MQPSKNSYSQILKATTLFSSVQFLTIVFSIIRTKVAALFIGSVGIGILGIFNVTINLITGISKFGLDVSGVKEIAFAHKNGDSQSVENKIRLLKRLVWFTAILGALVTIIFAKYLSSIAFGNQEYTFSFVWLSLAVIFNQLATARLSILQGKRKLKQLANANVLSSFLSVLIVVPIYYFYRLEGIVAAIILINFALLIPAYYYTRNLGIGNKKQSSIKETLRDGKPMIILGLSLSVTSILAMLAGYLIQIYITNEGGLSEVGYYNAGFVIMNSYVGLIFTAMSKDYFPRLSSVADKIDQAQNLIGQQALIAVLFLVPIIVLFIVFSELVIKLLYTEEFTVIVGFVSVAILGMLFKAISWSMGYLIIAKGDSKVFIKTSIFFNSLMLIMNVLGYKYYGLIGLGYSFFIYYFIHLVGIYLIVRFRYKVNLSKELLRNFALGFTLCVVTFVINNFEVIPFKQIFNLFLIVVTLVLSVYQINAKVGLLSLFNKNRNE
ncbi:MAG: O-antigen translocase [bacterium]